MREGAWATSSSGEYNITAAQALCGKRNVELLRIAYTVAILRTGGTLGSAGSCV